MSEEKKIEPTYEIMIGDETIRLADQQSAKILTRILIDNNILTFQVWTIREKKEVKSE